MKIPKYIISKDENNKINWININLSNGNTKTEIINKSKDQNRELKKLNRKYPDLLEKYENKDYKESNEVIKNLKVSKWANILGGTGLTLLSTSLTQIDTDLIYYKFMAIASYLGGYLIANGLDIQKEISKLKSSQLDILTKKELNNLKLEKGKDIKNKEINKIIISGVGLLGISILNLKLSAYLIENQSYFTENIDLIKSITNAPALLSGITLKKGSNSIINMVNFEIDKENYILTEDEKEILNKEKQRKIKKQSTNQ